jgi:hypothetical protein
VSDAHGVSFNTRGPANTPSVVVLRMSEAPGTVTSDPPVPMERAWDPEHSLLRLSFQNEARSIRVAVSFRDRLGSGTAGLESRQ